MYLDPYFTLYQKKVNSKWIEDVNVKEKKLTRDHLHDLGINKDFLGRKQSQAIFFLNYNVILLRIYVHQGNNNSV